MINDSSCLFAQTELDQNVDAPRMQPNDSFVQVSARYVLYVLREQRSKKHMLRQL